MSSHHKSRISLLDLESFGVIYSALLFNFEWQDPLCSVSVSSKMPTVQFWMQVPTIKMQEEHYQR